ncbi:hypothetical protein HID58_074742, partial [Brassica napus]
VNTALIAQESEPEVDFASLVEIASGTIHHFSHDHDLMRLQANSEEKSGKLCQTCILPIDFGNFLILHMLYLSTCNRGSCGYMYKCYLSTCNRGSCGYMYKCPNKNLLDHTAYPYPLFLTHHLDDFWMLCSVCKNESLSWKSLHMEFTGLRSVKKKQLSITVGTSSLHMRQIHPYMKPGHKIKVNGLEIQIVSNNVVSRQPCHTCQCICEDKV